jgi:uncharacterized repeat protein (TIGR01451 family)
VRAVVVLIAMGAALVSASVVHGQSAVTTADLGVTQGVSNANPNVGDTVSFTVTLTDHGPGTATSVTVSDKLPAGLSFVAATPSQGTYVATTGVWTVGTVTTGVPQTLVVQATVASPAPHTNTAKVLHSGVPDPSAANNAASATVTPQQADLALAEVANHTTPNVGDTIAFTLTLTDKGPRPATNVTVTDLLPTGLSFVSAVPSQGTYNHTSGIWTVGTITTGNAPTLELSATVVSASTITNTATVTHADQYDPKTTNNSASVAVHPLRADLGLTATVAKPKPNVGDAVVLTVVVTNHGPAAATGVAVADLLPSGLAFVSAAPTRGTYDPGTGEWAIGSVAVGASATLALHATVVSPDPQTNTASVAHADQFDPTASNNTASATEQPQQANLVLTQLISDPTPSVGETVLYTITVTNAGPDAASAVTVSEVLPSGLSLVSASASRGAYKSGTWTVGSIPAGTAVTLALHVQITAPGTYSNTATVSHADQFDPDVSNNSATLTISV